MLWRFIQRIPSADDQAFETWVLSGGTSPSSQSCSLASAFHASAMRRYRFIDAAFAAFSESSRQFSAFCLSSSDCLSIGVRWWFRTDRPMGTRRKRRDATRICIDGDGSPRPLHRSRFATYFRQHCAGHSLRAACCRRAHLLAVALLLIGTRHATRKRLLIR